MSLSDKLVRTISSNRVFMRSLFAYRANRLEKVARLGTCENPQIMPRFGSAVNRFLRSSIVEVQKSSEKCTFSI